MKQNITDSLEKNYMPYTAHVIMQRALPEIDGFKPSQRRILYTMYLMGLLKGNRKKSQGVVGQTMFLHPHGDAAIYETLIRMSKDNEALLLPYIDSKGNFGKVYSRDMQYAAARYTEARLTEISKELFKDIDKNTIDMVDNYDGSLKEPRLLPVSFPNILTNAQSGTAVGMSSSIPSFNLKEVIDFTIAYLKNKNAIVSDYVTAPDFPTGGSIIYNKKDFENIYETGRGTFKIRATYRFEKNSIIFENVPYTTTFESIIDKISTLVKEGKMKEIVDIDDIYGKDTSGIEITVKNNTNKEVLVEKLFKMTQLEDTFGCNFNIVVNGKPQVLGFKQIIHEWVVFRAESIKRGAMFDKAKKENRRHLLLALKEVLLDIDKAIKIIRETKKNSEVVANLMKEFTIDTVQAEFVADIKLKHLNEEYLIEKIDEIKTIEEEIASLDKLINDRLTLAKLIISELKEVKDKFGEDRKTTIINEESVAKVDTEVESIDDYNVKVFITKEGYLKKIPLTSLRGNFNIRVKDGDEIVKEVETTNNSEILVFTDKKNVYKYKAYELEDHKPSMLGEYLPTLIGLTDEEIKHVAVTNDFKGYMVFGFSDGKVAKVDMSAYETKTNRTMLKNAYADKEAIFFDHVIEDFDIMAVSSINKALIVNTSIINAKNSKNTIGSNVMKSKDDSHVVAYFKLDDVSEEFEYYRNASAGVGKYLKKDDLEEIFFERK